MGSIRVRHYKGNRISPSHSPNSLALKPFQHQTKHSAGLTIPLLSGIVFIYKEVAMRLTQELLSRYIGGQAEIQNQIEGYILRGEIDGVVLEGDEVSIRFAWFAKGDGYPPFPKRWVNEENLDYGLSLVEGFTSVSDIGPSGDGGANRIAIDSRISNELVVLFPPDGSKLDPAVVEGLVLAGK